MRPSPEQSSFHGSKAPLGEPRVLGAAPGCCPWVLSQAPRPGRSWGSVLHGEVGETKPSPNPEVNIKGFVLILALI